MNGVRKQGEGDIYCSILGDIHNDRRANIRHHADTGKVPIRNTIRQGDTISLLTVYEVLRRNFEKV